MIYRVTTIEELKKVASLAESLYKEIELIYKVDHSTLIQITSESWFKEISSNGKLGKKMFVIEENEEVVGFFAFTIYINELDGVLCSQENGWYVKEGNRGAGIKLLKKCESYAKSLGCKRFVIGHHQSAHVPKNLIKIYERMGYEHQCTMFGKEL